MVSRETIVIFVKESIEREELNKISIQERIELIKAKKFHYVKYGKSLEQFEESKNENIRWQNSEYQVCLKKIESLRNVLDFANKQL